MIDVVFIAKALGDESRARALMALVDGELCLCQIIEVLGLSPSTVSKHMTILHQAGLVKRRKAGRWHFYRLSGKDADPIVRQALRWAIESLKNDRRIINDTQKIGSVRGKSPEEFSACYVTK